jgi:hypothetical protein
MGSTSMRIDQYFAAPAVASAEIAGSATLVAPVSATPGRMMRTGDVAF